MTRKQYLGLLGFLFVAAWAGFDFGIAILCLVGAGVAAGVAAIIEGDVDLAEVQDRMRGGGATHPTNRPPRGAPPRP